MLFSLSWLRSMCPVQAGPEAIAAALTSRGLTVDAVASHADDHVFDVDVPANRPDCLGHVGLARELGAAFGVALHEAAQPTLETMADPSVSVEVDAPDLCRRYTARIVREVHVGPSPAWVIQRLESCGLRSINNVVDASNLVMLETGNPIHFFDLARIGGARVRIRLARAGERLVTLDGVDRVLDERVLVIADAERPIALAGLIGGAESEIGPATRQVLVEAAWFLPRSVRGTARRLGLKTDAAHRFERGVDPEGVTRAQALAARLLAEIAGAGAATALVDVHPRPLERRTLRLRPPQVERLLGYAPGPAEIEGALGALGLGPERDGSGRLSVAVPSWRVDLEREADLVEEVARHLGYDRIPATLTGLPVVPADPVGSAVDGRMRELLAGRGFHEAFGYAMIGQGEDDAFVGLGSAPPLRLTNPIAEGLACLRRSILPGLIRAVDLNLRRGSSDVRLFEIGHVFHGRAAGELPAESVLAGLVWSGAGQPRHWSLPDREVDLLDVSGVVEYLLDALGPGARLRRRPHDLPAFQPGLSVRWETEDGETLAWAGALHPERARKIDARVFAAELDAGRLAREGTAIPRYRALPRHTEVARDLSLILDAGASYERILAVLSAVPAPAPEEFVALDRFEGPPLDPGQFSLTVRVRLTPRDRTLTDDEIERYRRALIEALAGRLGVRIRE